MFISKDTILTEKMLILKSPGTGIEWTQRGLIIGKKAINDIEADVTLSVSDFYE
jgi:sialic acid synthase SpsE